ncbi:MAG TPA: alcohol dehydrogenase catalytic domain-containing protein [Pirellulales bacterium]
MRAIAAFPGSSTPRLVDIPEPAAPGPGEVLCRTVELGLCGTDREILHSKAPEVPPGESFLVLGHECLGRVEAVGAGVTALAVGDLVTPTVRRDRSKLPWRLDMQALGGHFTERGIMSQHGFSAPLWVDPQQYLLKVDPKLRNVAVFAEPLSVCEKAINEAMLVQKGRLGPEDRSVTEPRVLVTGLGPIAFAGLIAAKARGWEVTVCGRDAHDTFRATLVERLGGKYVAQNEIVFDIKDAEREGWDLILECTGSDELYVASSAALAARGVIVVIGATRSPAPANLNISNMMLNMFMRNNIHLGTVNSAARDFADALKHLGVFQETHSAALQAMLTAHLPPEEALAHYTGRQNQAIKTVVTYE